MSHHNNSRQQPNTSSSLSSILQQARASLAHPSRPETPRVDSRHMMNAAGMLPSASSSGRPSSRLSAVDGGSSRPQTAYGWQDAMGTPPSATSSVDFDFPTSNSGDNIDSLVMHSKDSIQEKRFNKEKKKRLQRKQKTDLKQQDLVQKTNRLSISDRTANESASTPASSQKQTSGASMQENVPSSKQPSKAATPSSASDASTKDDQIKARIFKTINNYDADKLLAYCERAKKIAHRDDIGSMFIRECIITGLKQLLKKHSGSQEDDSKLLKLISVVLTSFESSLDRQPLFGFCRVLYKLSKDSSHDSEFRENQTLNPIMKLARRMCDSVKGKKDWEMLLYCIAILKNVSYDSQENKNYLSSHDALSLLKLVLEAIVRYVAKERRASEQSDRPLQLLVQATACLRNLAHTEKDFDAISESGLIQILTPMMKNLVAQQEFVLNTCRVLSKVSLHSNCQSVMNAEDSFYSTLLMVLQHYKDNVAIVIRICFILGNLTFDNAEKRTQFSMKTEVPLLLNLLDTFDKKDAEMCEEEKDSSDDADTEESSVANKKKNKARRDMDDLLTKLIRLIANISIDHERGSYLAFSMQTHSLIRILSRKSVQTAEELVLNVVRCITNLTYYGNEARSQATSSGSSFVPESTLFTHKMQLCELLSPLLLHDHPDAILEAARTFGNLSQDVEVQEWMQQKRLDEVMLILIDHSNFDIVSAVCGVLINLTGKETEIFSGTSVERLIEVLDYANEDLAILIFKLLHNLVVNTPTDKLDHLDLIYDHVEGIVESLEEHDDLTEEEETLVQIGKRLLEELAYEEL